jgi:Flp pilus assembly protein TadD
VTESVHDRARRLFADGEFARCRETAVDALRETPDDVALLRLAGRAAYQLNSEEAVGDLRRATELEPDDASTWRHLGSALIAAGKVGDAAVALGRAVKLEPGDAAVPVDLGHTLIANGRPQEAVEWFEHALAVQPELPAALRGVIEAYRRLGRFDDARQAAARLVEVEPDDIVALLDLADLSVAAGRFDDGVEAYERLRQRDPEPGHEVFALHGMIQAEVRRRRWRRVLDLALEATRVDRMPLTTDLLALARARVFGARNRPTPAQAAVERALELSQAHHRELHEEIVGL